MATGKSKRENEPERQWHGGERGAGAIGLIGLTCALEPIVEGAIVDGSPPR
jgi:hypothetical protein